MGTVVLEVVLPEFGVVVVTVVALVGALVTAVAAVLLTVVLPVVAGVMVAVVLPLVAEVVVLVVVASHPLHVLSHSPGSFAHKFMETNCLQYSNDILLYLFAH